MKWKTIIPAVSLAFLAALPASAEWVLGPGLSPPRPVETGCRFISAESAEGAYPVYRGGTALQRARMNAASEVEADHFARRIARYNEDEPTKGLLSWEEGMDGDYTSFVMVEMVNPERAAHPTTRAVGYTFDNMGHHVSLKDLLPGLTVEDVNAAIEKTASERDIILFEKHTVRTLPRNFYIGKDGTIYAIYQQYELAPYAAGILVVPLSAIH